MKQTATQVEVPDGTPSRYVRTQMNARRCYLRTKLHKLETRKNARRSGHERKKKSDERTKILTQTYERSDEGKKFRTEKFSFWDALDIAIFRLGRSRHKHLWSATVWTGAL